MGFLSGKRILVTGVASKLSIAYGIAQAMHREGAELAFTYQNDKLKGRVEEFAAQLGSSIVLECDVAQDESIDGMRWSSATVRIIALFWVKKVKCWISWPNRVALRTASLKKPCIPQKRMVGASSAFSHQK